LDAVWRQGCTDMGYCLGPAPGQKFMDSIMGACRHETKLSAPGAPIRLLPVLRLALRDFLACPACKTYTSNQNPPIYHKAGDGVDICAPCTVNAVAWRCSRCCECTGDQRRKRTFDVVGFNNGLAVSAGALALNIRLQESYLRAVQTQKLKLRHANANQNVSLAYVREQLLDFVRNIWVEQGWPTMMGPTRRMDQSQLDQLLIAGLIGAVSRATIDVVNPGPVQHPRLNCLAMVGRFYEYYHKQVVVLAEQGSYVVFALIEKAAPLLCQALISLITRHRLFQEGVLSLIRGVMRDELPYTQAESLVEDLHVLE
jgi:hypothetical protein